MKGVKICFPEKFHWMKIGHQIQFTGKIQIFAPNIGSFRFDEIFQLVIVEHNKITWKAKSIENIFPNFVHLHFCEIFLTVGSFTTLDLSKGPKL